MFIILYATFAAIFVITQPVFALLCMRAEAFGTPKQIKKEKLILIADNKKKR